MCGLRFCSYQFDLVDAACCRYCAHILCVNHARDACLNQAHAHRLNHVRQVQLEHFWHPGRFVLVGLLGKFVFDAVASFHAVDLVLGCPEVYAKCMRIHGACIVTAVLMRVILLSTHMFVCILSMFFSSSRRVLACSSCWYAPRKNYEANRVERGSLHVCEGSHVLVNETALSPGQLPHQATYAV
jgi:hypothetical protein